MKLRYSLYLPLTIFWYFIIPYLCIFRYYIFYIFLYLLVVFLLKYDILSLTSYITKFLTHVYYTYYNIIILTIPEWLNNEALRLNLNFSQVLQEALLTKIQSHWTIILLFVFYTTHHLWSKRSSSHLHHQFIQKQTPGRKSNSRCDVGASKSYISLRDVAFYAAIIFTSAITFPFGGGLSL